MENDPNRDLNRDLNRDKRTYNKDDNSYSGWVIVGLIVFVIAVVALYQTRVRTTDNLTNIEPAAGASNTTNTMDSTNTMSPNNNMDNVAPDTAPANTTTP
jgi:hypothetical protein